MKIIRKHPVVFPKTWNPTKSPCHIVLCENAALNFHVKIKNKKTLGFVLHPKTFAGGRGLLTVTLNLQGGSVFYGETTRVLCNFPKILFSKMKETKWHKLDARHR